MKDSEVEDADFWLHLDTSDLDDEKSVCQSQCDTQHHSIRDSSSRCYGLSPWKKKKPITWLLLVARLALLWLASVHRSYYFNGVWIPG